MARITYLMVMVLAMLVAMEAGEANGFDCDGPERKQASAMCRAFITSPQIQEPSGPCCMAYRILVETAKTRAESRQLCSCVQRRARLNDVPVNIANLDSLQEKCGLPFRYSGSPDFDCNTVK
ncbi:hypothetical protein OROMI_016752 [Orobanche minor]